MGMVGAKADVRVVDVTGVALASRAAPAAAASTVDSSSAAEGSAAAAAKDKKKKSVGAAAAGDGRVESHAADGHNDPTAAVSTGSTVKLPAGLSQSELHVPATDKDALAYLYLLQHPGRTLVFVNSIKTARRLDGLLRALGLDCRALHAQLQQRQRLRALEAYQLAPRGVLVATDVAARGLDISEIASVVHFDVARSPQIYIHRSGRSVMHC
jgi:ATP-dependent RNA helicase DDX24/MAK5